MVVAPRAVIITIGEELLEGRVQDTNSRLLAAELLRMGVLVRRFLTIGDAAGALRATLEQLRGDCDLILTTGGLGPTADDRVRAEVAALLGVPLDDVEGAVDVLQSLWRRQHGTEAPSYYLSQARVPLGALPLRNEAGTAWGFSCQLGKDICLMCLPGPPGEVSAAFFDGGGRAELLRRFGVESGLAFATFHTAGVPEPTVEARIRDLIEREGNPRIGIVANLRAVTVSVMAYADPDGRGAEEILAQASAEIQGRIGDLIWGRDEETLPGVLVRHLNAAGQTVATAESCTGGRVAAALTSVPGSSEVFRYGWVTYADEAKTRQLGVAERLLREHGAVSAEVARAMAEGARRLARADWGLAATGVAGPGGGSRAKPVGLVWIGIAGPEASLAIRRRAFARAGRASIQAQSVRDALEALRREVLGLPRLPDRE